MAAVLGRVRAGEGPHIVEADTYRWHGHYEGDPQRYRDSDEVTERREQDDPIERLRQRLRSDGVDGTVLDAIEAEVIAQLSDDEEAARVAEPPPGDRAPRARGRCPGTDSGTDR